MKNGGTQSGKHRSYILTENNPGGTTVPDQLETAKSLGCASFTGQPEVGKEGTKHHQFCFQFTNPQSFHRVKQAFPRAHIEPSKNYRAAAEYCSKEDTRASGAEPTVFNPPKKRELKATRKERNGEIMAMGAELALTEGLIPVS